MKKPFAGKIILVGLLLSCVVTGVVLKKVFKDSSSFKNLVTEQMRMEFLSYVVLKNPTEQIQVASLGGVQYLMDLKAPWSFTIHQKTLLIKAPELIPAPSAEVQTQVHEQAQKSIAEAAKIWLADKFHTQKDLLVEVSF